MKHKLGLSLAQVLTIHMQPAIRFKTRLGIHALTSESKTTGWPVTKM